MLSFAQNYKNREAEQVILISLRKVHFAHQDDKNIKCV